MLRHEVIRRHLMLCAALMLCVIILPACQTTGSSQNRGISGPQESAAFSTFIANLPTTEKEAINAIRTTNDFAGINMGISGVSQPTFFAYRSLLNHPKAPELFYALVNEAKMPGKMYALCGLYDTDRETFNSVIAQFLSRSDYRVMTLDNVAREETVAQIAAKIADGTWPKRLRTAEPTYRMGIPESEWTDLFGPWQYRRDF